MYSAFSDHIFYVHVLLRMLFSAPQNGMPYVIECQNKARAHSLIFTLLLFVRLLENSFIWPERIHSVPLNHTTPDILNGGILCAVLGPFLELSISFGLIYSFIPFSLSLIPIHSFTSAFVYYVACLPMSFSIIVWFI